MQGPTLAPAATGRRAAHRAGLAPRPVPPPRSTGGGPAGAPPPSTPSPSPSEAQPGAAEARQVTGPAASREGWTGRLRSTAVPRSPVGPGPVPPGVW